MVHVHEETWSVIQNRYRREAIAYSRIFPGAGMSLGRAAGLALTNVLSDYAHAILARRLWRNALSIPRFRLAQFAGTWQGFRSRENLSTDLLQRFYYPAEVGTTTKRTHPGRAIDYGKK